MEINKIKNKEEKGLSGLANLGNTCFINASLQILSHTYELNEFLDKEIYKKKIKNIPESNLLIEWDNLRKLLWSQNCVISPNRFFKTLQNVAEIKKKDIFTGYFQNDASEFLLFLIDCFHEAISRNINITISGKMENETDKIAVKCFEMIKTRYSKDYSEIWNMFYAVQISEIYKINDKEKTILSITPEPYFTIQLPIPPNNKSPTLIDCFNFFIQGENIPNFKTENGEEIEINKKLSFWSFPNILVIVFKRFDLKLEKNKIYIDFPFELDLSSYVVGYKKEEYKYELYGVCNHIGLVLGGHYTSYVKNVNDKWFHFNDKIVSKIALNEKIVSNKAYVLFYRKKTT